MMEDINQKKSKFLSEDWVEGRHDYLKSLPSNEAKELIESLDEDDVFLNVNVRKFQQSYICDYLEDLWHISPEAFWQHIKISLLYPEGTLISDNNFHLEIMCNEEMPIDVWITVLETLLFADHEALEMTTFEVIRAQTTTSKNRKQMQQELIAWINNIDGKSKAHLEKTWDKMEEYYDFEIPPLNHVTKTYVSGILRKVFYNAIPEWLEGVLVNEKN